MNSETYAKFACRRVNEDDDGEKRVGIVSHAVKFSKQWFV